jgi:hypothetical protein
VSDIAIGVGAASALVVSCSHDQSLRLWHAATGQSLGCIVLPGPGRCLALTHLEKAAFVGLSDGAIVCVQIHHRRVLPGSRPHDWGRMLSHKRAVTCMCLSSDGLCLVSGVARQRDPVLLCLT